MFDLNPGETYSGLSASSDPRNRRYEGSQLLHCGHHCRSVNIFNNSPKGHTSLTLSGEYLHKVEAVMARVDAITEDLDHMPLAAFIYRQKPVLDKEVEVWPL